MDSFLVGREIKMAVAGSFGAVQADAIVRQPQSEFKLYKLYAKLEINAKIAFSFISTQCDFAKSCTVLNICNGNWEGDGKPKIDFF